MGGTLSSSNKKKKYSGKLIVITGGGSGMGLEMAKSFAQDGAQVVITGRTESKLETAAKEHKNITPFVCDVAKDEDMIKLHDAMEKKGGVDFLINNAGVAHDIDFLDETNKISKQFQEVDIDINGVLRGVHYFLPMLKKKDSARLMIVSLALVYVPYAKMPVYCACKAFLHSYTQSLRVQLSKTNIKVIELLPPLVETPMTAHMKKDGDFVEMQVDKASTRTKMRSIQVNPRNCDSCHTTSMASSLERSTKSSSKHLLQPSSLPPFCRGSILLSIYVFLKDSLLF